MALINMIDRGDDASDALFLHLKTEFKIAGREITRIRAAENLLHSLTPHEFEFERESVYVPTLWTENKLGPWVASASKQVADLMFLDKGVRVKFIYPFVDKQLIDIVKMRESNALKNGDCAHRTIPEEQCGMCMNCLEKYLVYTELGFETEDLFLEDPIDGHGSRERIYELLQRVCYPPKGKDNQPSRQEIAIAHRLAQGFFNGTIPTSLAKVIERRFRPITTF